jgi:hypothetical protein
MFPFKAEGHYFSTQGTEVFLFPLGKKEHCCFHSGKKGIAVSIQGKGTILFP